LKTVLSALALLLAPLSGHLQAVRIPVAFAYARLSAYAPRFADALSSNSNVAVLASLDTASIGINSEKRFMLAGLSAYQAAAAIPTPVGHFGVNASFGGSEAYRETGIGFSYARRLGPLVSAGVRFNYIAVNAGSYGSAGRISAEAGILVRVAERVMAGLHVADPGGSRMGKNGERTRGLYTAGLGCELSGHSFLAVEIQKEEGEPVSVNAGLQYGFARTLWARGGFTSAASQFYLGLGVGLTLLRVDVVATLHPYLGVTPGLAVLYTAKRHGR
jgi:hypothetical protein